MPPANPPGTTTPPATPPGTATPPATPPGTATPPATGGGKTETVNEPAPATILVNLPENARLLVDGTPTTGTGASRLLVSPNLNRGIEYSYTLRAEVVRDGQTLVQTQNVAVRAGEQSRVNFEFNTTGVAANR